VEVLNIKFQENLSRGVTLTHADGQTGGHEEANSYFSHTNVPKTIKAKIISDKKDGDIEKGQGSLQTVYCGKKNTAQRPSF
jgi:hypothetical protein